ncbi:MAG TPA: sulfatase [Phycisphaerae bacterium]|nr:sulfatase [Phycisphaerae bacterium]HNU46515.1 sulfatase [Phycisphaerae bacterium]
MRDLRSHPPADNTRGTFGSRRWRTCGLLLVGTAVALTTALVARPQPSRAARQTVEAFHAVPALPAKGPNVLILCIDALRPDHTSLHGYPRDTTPQLKRFFGGATVFERAYAPAAITTPSVIGMLSGRYPQNHAVRLLCQKVPDTTILLSDHLRRSGYQTAAVVSNAVLSDAACGLAARFDHYDDRVDEVEANRPHMFERRAARTTDAALDWLRNHCDADRPHLLYLHYIDPHGPYTPPAECPARYTHDTPRMIDMTGRGGGIHPEGELDGLDLVDRYDEEIAYADQEAGRLLSEYQQLGYLEDALVILCADHGEAMMEHDHWFAHGMYVYEEIIRIPLAIRYQGMPAGRIAAPVSLIDVAPTVLAAVGLPLPADLDGRSLLAPPLSRPLLSEARGNSGLTHNNSHNGNLWRCLIHDHRKITARIGRSGPIREQHLYDLRTDPLELAPQPVAEGDRLFAALRGFIEADPDPAGIPRELAWGDLPAPNVAPTVDQRTLEALRSLGYIQ